MAPTPAANGYVPWGIYLDDRRSSTERLDRMEGKIDRILDRQEKFEVAAAREDGQEAAEQAAEVALERNRRRRGEVVRDVCLCVFSAALTIGGAILISFLTGGPT